MLCFTLITSHHSSLFLFFFSLFFFIKPLICNYMSLRANRTPVHNSYSHIHTFASFQLQIFMEGHQQTIDYLFNVTVITGKIPVHEWKPGLEECGLRMCRTRGCKSIQTLSSYCLGCSYISELSEWNADDLIQGRPTVPDRKNSRQALDCLDVWKSGKIRIQEPYPQSENLQAYAKFSCRKVEQRRPLVSLSDACQTWTLFQLEILACRISTPLYTRESGQDKDSYVSSASAVLRAQLSTTSYHGYTELFGSVWGFFSFFFFQILHYRLRIIRIYEA